MSDNYALIKTYAKSPEVIQRFSEILGPNRAASYVYSVIIAVSSDDRLQQCSAPSIMKAAARAATLNLSCDPGIGEAYLVPYKGEATFQLGWRGLRNMAYRTGKVLYLNVNALYEGQEWVEDQMTGVAHIEGQATSKEPIGYFAYLETKDHRVNTFYMTVEEIKAHKEQYAQGYNSKYSPWNTAFDKMARKTVLRQLLSTWAELKPDEMEMIDSAEAIDSIDDMPDVDSITIIEPEKKTEAQLLDELGFGDTNAKVKVIEGEAKEKKDSKEAPTNYPGSQAEYYSWCAQGNIPYVGVKDAQDALKRSKGEIDIAFENLLALSKEREAQNEQQDTLL